MNHKSIILMSFSLLILSNCVAPLIVGGSAAVGTMALKDKGISGTMSDSSINAAVDAKLYQHSSEIFTQVDVDVYMGEVLLTGIVKQPEQGIEAEKLTWKTAGVRSVYNHIKTSEENSLLDFTSDTWITAKIKGKLLTEKGVNSLNYFIKTVGGTVYIMGFADNVSEMDKVKTLISQTNGVKEIISYAIIRDNE